MSSKSVSVTLHERRVDVIITRWVTQDSHKVFRGANALPVLEVLCNYEKIGSSHMRRFPGCIVNPCTASCAHYKPAVSDVVRFKDHITECVLKHFKEQVLDTYTYYTIDQKKESVDNLLAKQFKDATMLGHFQIDDYEETRSLLTESAIFHIHDDVDGFADSISHLQHSADSNALWLPIHSDMHILPSYKSPLLKVVQAMEAYWGDAVVCDKGDHPYHTPVGQ